MIMKREKATVTPNPGAGLLGCLLCSLPTQTEIDRAATDDQGCSMNQHAHACASFNFVTNIYNQFYHLHFIEMGTGEA